MSELKYPKTILAILTVLFSVSLGQLPSPLERQCDTPRMQGHIESTCRHGSIYGCQRQPRSERHRCWRTYTCRGMYRRSLSLLQKCAIICSLMRLSARLPADPHWRDNIMRRAYVRLEREFSNGVSNWTSMLHRPPIKSRVYEFFNDIELMEVASITYRTSLCAYRDPDANTQCRLDLRNNTQVRQLCRSGTMALCRRVALDGVENHCSRQYRCDGLTQEINADGIRKCGLLCWVFEHAFLDFPNGNLPVNQRTFDFLVYTKNSNSNEWDDKRYMVDVGVEDARKVVYTTFHLAFDNREQFDVKVQVASRNCYLNKPPICRDQDYQNYHVGKIMYPNYLAGCSFPSSLDVRYATLVARGGVVTLPPPNECSVFVQCDFTSYFRTHGWRRLDWCRFMDWMFMKSVTWLGLGSKATTSDMITTISLFNSGPIENGSFIQVTGRGRTLPLKSALAYYDNFTGETSGYFANHFVLSQVFRNCLHVTNGSARVEILGRDYCPNRTYFNPLRNRHMDNCFTSGSSDNRNSTARCTFVPAHPLDHKCAQLYWVIHRALYWHCHVGAHLENHLINISMRAIDNNRHTYTRTLSPILRNRAVPYIKNFVVNIFNTLTMLRIESRFPPSVFDATTDSTRR